MKFSNRIKSDLLHCIENLDGIRDVFVAHPDIDFTRESKLSFSTMLSLILSMEAGSLKDELFKYFGLQDSVPSVSAFVQQRKKILPFAFSELFYMFNEVTERYLSIPEYRLCAFDGSSIPISYDPHDTETYLPNMNKDSKGYNEFHLNALYDLDNLNYIDIEIQPGAKMNETRAACDIVDRYSSKNKTIFIADRGYESWNLYTHIMLKNQFFLIRVKDIHSNGQISNLPQQENEEFDIDWKVILTRHHTNYVKQHKELYRYLSSTSVFDYIRSKDDPDYELNLRVVRFKITEDSYESIMTNLDREEFPMNKIKELYNNRWGIETSFKELKYSVGMNSFHAKMRDSIRQDIYARVIMYNFSMLIARHISIRHKKKPKHSYQVNFTRCIHLCKYFFKLKEGGESPPDVELLISKEILPVRPNRHDPRKVVHKSAVPFNYRFD